MISYPNAKINLGLDIVARRPDGYHDIETLFVPYMGLRDVLEIVPSDSFGMTLYGIPIDGDVQDNLCARAWRLLNDLCGIPPVHIHLYKKIPFGAGLGGGSADATFTLKMLDGMFSLGLSDGELAKMASRLGSDCPFFVYNRPMLASGRGEVLEEFDLPALDSLRIELVTPDVHVSTREAYAGVTPGVPSVPLREILPLPPARWRELLKNDFERSVFGIHPSLARMKQEMYDRGAIYASMSGSGSSIYGLFKKD